MFKYIKKWEFHDKGTVVKTDMYARRNSESDRKREAEGERR